MSVRVNERKCSACGADLVPNTNFCRRCGSATIPDSEQTTAILHSDDSTTTRPLNPRVTSPTRSSTPGTSSRRGLLIGVAVLILIIGLIGASQLIRSRNQTPAAANRQLNYPGSRTVLDMTEKDGRRTLHLQTSDPLDKVESWYQSSLKLTKTTRLTANSFVMKGDNSVITLVAEDGTTNILIKQNP